MSAGRRALTDAEREHLAAIRAADSLADLAAVVGADGDHEAYVEAKPEWHRLRAKELPPPEPAEGIPGRAVEVGGTPVHVHGVTHADTREERRFLRRHVADLLEAGAAVHCEQGIRPMYFDDYGAVREMDDYRWAMARCEELDVDSHVEGFEESEVEEVVQDVASLAGEFRETVYSLIDSGEVIYGDTFESVLGDLASDFLTSHGEMAMGLDFESFRLSELAARNPRKLPRLQRYYEREFLPQPLEREWLRRHDPELELVTHARNERMADWAVYHAEGTPLHLIVGAAHGPGLRYYLERYREGERRLEGVEPFQ